MYAVFLNMLWQFMSPIQVTRKRGFSKYHNNKIGLESYLSDENILTSSKSISVRKDKAESVNKERTINGLWINVIIVFNVNYYYTENSIQFWIFIYSG